MAEHAEPVVLSLIFPRSPSGAPKQFLKDPFLSKYSSLGFCFETYPYETSQFTFQVPVLASCQL